MPPEVLSMEWLVEKAPAELPLFPLPLVLFPGASLPLHIFEPRYKEMIGECLALDNPFGIVCQTEERMAGLGCSSVIVDVMKRFEDGRMNITVAGRRRFRLLEVLEGRAFLRGRVEYLEDERDSEDLRELASRVREAFRRLSHRRGWGPNLAVDLSSSPRELVWLVAASDDCEIEVRQKLLEMASTGKRLTTLLSWLETLGEESAERGAH
jgi:Lon protease-like protein